MSHQFSLSFYRQAEPWNPTSEDEAIRAFGWVQLISHPAGVLPGNPPTEWVQNESNPRSFRCTGSALWLFPEVHPTGFRLVLSHCFKEQVPAKPEAADRAGAVTFSHVSVWSPWTPGCSADPLLSPTLPGVGVQRSPLAQFTWPQPPRLHLQMQSLLNSTPANNKTLQIDNLEEVFHSTK